MITEAYKTANGLRLSYLSCKDVRQATKILLQWKAQMAIIHAMQDEIISLFRNELSDETTQSDLSQVLWLVECVQ